MSAPTTDRHAESSPSPSMVAAAWCEAEGVVWLDSGAGEFAEHSHWSHLAHSPERVLAGHIDSDWDAVMACVAQQQRPRAAGDADGAASPLTGGLIGWVGFDGRFRFGLYREVLSYDHTLARWAGADEVAARAAAARATARRAAPVLDFVPLLERAAYIAAVQRAQQYIGAGDVYQVNLAYPWLAAWPADADALALYERLRGVSPAPYAAYLQLGGTRVLSSSPESFLRMDGQHIETRPIKGTRPRVAHDALRDAASRCELERSAKENAELLMITDLQRNDLGQVCAFGSVQVPRLAAVETFAQVFHLVSTVTGTLRDGVSHAEAFRSCFPGGSISGAPKRRALEIIDELEPHARGLYTGAIGYFGFDGRSQFSIAIRTAVQEGERIGFHVGSGIVADSVPELEHEETLHKAAGLLRAARGYTSGH